MNEFKSPHASHQVRHQARAVDQNRKYFCASGRVSAGSHVSSSPSAVTSNVSGSTWVCVHTTTGPFKPPLRYEFVRPPQVPLSSAAPGTLSAGPWQQQQQTTCPRSHHNGIIENQRIRSGKKKHRGECRVLSPGCPASRRCEPSRPANVARTAK